MQYEGKKKKIPILKRVYRYIKRLNTTDRLAYVSLIIAIIFGSWGIRLTYKIKNTSLDVEHFNPLLTKTQWLMDAQNKIIALNDSQIKSLILINTNITKQVYILSGQYAINQDMQKNINENALSTRIADKAKFFKVVITLDSITGNANYTSVNAKISSWSENSRKEYINKIITILSSQLDNSFLISDKYMYREWETVLNSLQPYNYSTSIKSNELWLQSFKDILDLSNNTYVYMNYSTFWWHDYRGIMKEREKWDENEQIE
jgi:hypothetical protein